MDFGLDLAVNAKDVSFTSDFQASEFVRKK